MHQIFHFLCQIYRFLVFVPPSGSWLAPHAYSFDLRMTLRMSEMTPRGAPVLKPLWYKKWNMVLQEFAYAGGFVEPRGFSNLYMLVVRQEPLRYTSVFFVYSGCSNLLYSLEVSVICICWWFQSSVYSSGA